MYHCFQTKFRIRKKYENIKEQVDNAKAEFMDYFQFYEFLFWFNYMP